MTANRRIALNVVATYGRSLYSLVLGLFAGRWVLMSLGEVDYGLYGVIGGLTAFVEFVNSMMSAAVARFFAFSVGAAKKNSCAQKGLEDCRRWFSSAVLVHVTLPLCLMIIGYPMGVWAIENFLTIPGERLLACIWVWRYACLSCFVGMVNVPFAAMYNAKQEIAELTVYGIIKTTANFCFLCYMVNHPSVWLSKYAAWTCFISIFPQLIICVRAIQKYPECRFVLLYAKNWLRIREMLEFAACRLWGGISIMFSNQGMAILVNKLLGPAANASMNIGNNVASHTLSLSSALSGAFSPALTNAAGEGELGKMRSLAFRTCRFGPLLMLIFAIPVSLEVHELMILWLKKPPAFAAELCVCMLVVEVLEKMTDGHWMSIFALGNIAKYQITVSFLGPMAVFIAWGFIGIEMGIVGVGFGLIVAKFLAVLVRLYFGRTLCGMSARFWIKSVFIPIFFTTFVTFVFGSLPHFFMGQSFLRLCVTTVICEFVFLPLMWFAVLSKSERTVVISKFPVFQ